MNRRKFTLPLSFLSVLLLLLLLTVPACTLLQGRLTPPTPFVFSSPNPTLTALFAPLTATPTSPPAPPTATAPPLPSVTPTASPVPPSATPAPSATPPPASPTPLPSVRQPQVLAPYAVSRLHIDGDWSEWPVLYNYVFKHVVYGADKYSGRADLSGIYRVAWDERYLYVGVRVIDDRYVQEAKGRNLYKGDSFEIQVDTNLFGDFFVAALNNDDYQLGFSAGPTVGTHMEAYRWYPAYLAGPIAGVKMGAQTLSGGAYLVEVAVPWNQLQVTPYQGLKLGFCISLSDNDNDGKQKQQTMISNCPHRRLTDPTSWGTLILAGAP